MRQLRLLQGVPAPGHLAKCLRLLLVLLLLLLLLLLACSPAVATAEPRDHR
jgi:hypothetical protein